MRIKNVALYVTLALAGLIFSGCIITTQGTVSSNVRVREPSVVVVANDDPELVVIPGTYVYWMDGRDDDVFFYGGVWWRPYGNAWYRADDYSGRWTVIEPSYVPRPVRTLPANWKHGYKEAPRVRWRDARSNWRGWERDRYWEQRRWRRDDPRGRK
jgi:hypothetical protein